MAEARTAERWVPASDAQARRGGNGTVIKVHDRDDKVEGAAAKKSLRQDRLHRYDRFRREAQIAQSLNHENLVKVLDVYLPSAVADPEDPPFIVTPWYPRGTLHDRLTAKSYAGRVHAAAVVLLPLARALAYLHAEGRYHRDIKPRNVLFDDADRPILCDFGLCFDVDEDHLTLSEEVVGSIGYRAPEYVGGRLTIDDHGPGDVFSLGKMFWAMLAAVDVPPDGPIMAYPKHNLVALGGAELQDVQHLIQGMTSQARDERPTIDEVIRELEAVLDPPTLAPKARPNAIRSLKAFTETDPQLAAHHHRESQTAQDAADVRARLMDVRAVVEADADVQGLLAAYPQGADLAFSAAVQGPGDHHPGEREDLASSLGFELPPAQAVTVVLAPSDLLRDRVPMVLVVWSIAGAGRRVRVLSYVYTRGTAATSRGSSPMQFPITLDSSALRTSLHGLVRKQLDSFFSTISDVVAAAATDRKQ